MTDQKQNFLGGVIASVIAKKGIEFAVKKGLEAAAKSSHTAMTKADVPIATEVVVKSVQQEVQSRVDHITSNEPILSSRNMWGSLVGIITAVDLMQRMWFDGLPNTATDYLTPLGIIIASLTPIYSRYIAKKPLGQ